MDGLGLSRGMRREAEAGIAMLAHVATLTERLCD
jgi:hypothetical protein